MDWKELGKKIVELGAPLLGTALGGPGGAALGSLVAKTVGGNPKDPADLLKRIEADSQAAMKLRELEMKHEEEILKIRLADVASARRREVEVVRATGKKDIFLYFLAMLVVVGFFTLCALLMYNPLPEGSTQAVFLLFGALATGFGSVLNYFFGSSKSSKEKTELLAKRV